MMDKEIYSHVCKLQGHDYAAFGGGIMFIIILICRRCGNELKTSPKKKKK